MMPMHVAKDGVEHLMMAASSAWPCVWLSAAFGIPRSMACPYNVKATLGLGILLDKELCLI